MCLPAALLSACGAPEAPRSVVLISLDTLRADAGLFEDREVAPELYALAQRGLYFTQASSGTSWTLPSHAQMFTGQAPALHGTEDDNLRIDASTPTLPERFSDAGWRTFGCFTGWYLLGDFGFSRGFEMYENVMPLGRELEQRWRDELSQDRGARALTTWQAADLQSHRAITSPNVADFASNAIREAGDAPLFLFLHLFDPHYDYVPPPPFDTRFDPDYAGDIDGKDFYVNPRIWKDGVRTVSERDLEHIRALYLGEIAWTDEHLGRVLDQLEAAGRTPGTSLAVVADHGEEFFEHGRVGHRHTLYDEAIRIPFLLVPSPALDLAQRGRSELAVGLSDLAPSLLELAGLPALPQASGRSLVPLLRGETLPAVPQIGSVRFRPIVAKQGGRNVARHLIKESLRTPEHKLIRETWVKDGKRRLEAVEWYDLLSDPGEQQPIRDLADPRLRSAWEQLETELARHRDLHGAAPHSSEEQRHSRAAELFGSQLALLGYLPEDSKQPDPEGDGGEAPAPAPEEPADEAMSLEVLRLPWGIAPAPAWSLEEAAASRR
jgi:arylsulfatase A-like enzyme